MTATHTLRELAERVGATVIGDGDISITGVASVRHARLGDITFLAERAYRNQLADCQASAVILAESDQVYWTGNALVTRNPYLCYAKVAQCLETTPQPRPVISATAVVAPDVTLGDNITIEDYAVIESGVQIGDGTIIGAHCTIGERVKIGHRCRLWPQVTLYHNVTLGDDCRIHSGTVVGSDGFGFANDRNQWIRIPQLGRVTIGNRVDIGAGTTIDRGTLEDTQLADGVIIDNQCHIAHNVVIGAHTAIAGGVIIAGRVKIGQYCRIGGASVLNSAIEICDYAAVTGMAMVMRSITEKGVYSSGIPAESNAVWRKKTAQLLKIDQLYQRVKALEQIIK
ncbi:MAG: UDP-3-O-(3-hydroxymyristoyl)glucosamine N-acyltransferase [Candidatus Symbiodolus clandestinus]